MRVANFGVAFLSLACGMFFVSAGFADVIPVNNSSFETLPSGGLPFKGCGTLCSFSETAIPGWTETGSTIQGQFQPGPASNGYFSVPLPDGTTLAFSAVAGDVISQTVGATVQVGATYTLQVDLGYRGDAGFSFEGSADLLINGNIYPATGFKLRPGTFGTYTAIYTGLLADAGDAITIELKDIGGQQADYDNVRLTCTSAPGATGCSGITTGEVPEPNSFALFGTVVVGIAMWRRRQVKACGVTR